MKSPAMPAERGPAVSTERSEPRIADDQMASAM